MLTFKCDNKINIYKNYSFIYFGDLNSHTVAINVDYSWQKVSLHSKDMRSLKTKVVDILFPGLCSSLILPLLEQTIKKPLEPLCVCLDRLKCKYPDCSREKVGKPC